MKTKRTLLLIIAMVAFVGLNTACTQNRTATTKSDSRIITKKYNVGNFSAIESGIVGNIVFTQSNRTSVTAEGD